MAPLLAAAPASIALACNLHCISPACLAASRCSACAENCVSWSGASLHRRRKDHSNPCPLIVQGSCRFCNAISRLLCTNTSPASLSLSLSPSPFVLAAACCRTAPEAMAGGSLYGLRAFNDLIRGGTLLYITSCPAAPSSLSLSLSCGVEHHR